MSTLFLVMEIIGTVAFTISGVMEGVRHDMDLFGVMMLGLTTAVGGGVIRDTIIGNTPPAAFVHPYCTIISLVVAAGFFLILYYMGTPVSSKLKRWMDAFLLCADTVGLAAFTVLGIESTTRFQAAPKDAVLLFVGVITGIGGGILRDVLAGSVPFVFRKHVYALASILGAVTMILLMRFVTQEIAAITGFSVVVLIRTLAAVFRWNLPRIQKVKQTVDANAAQ